MTMALTSPLAIEIMSTLDGHADRATKHAHRTARCSCGWAAQVLGAGGKARARQQHVNEVVKATVIAWELSSGSIEE
jgi:hypothetical protein